MSGSFSKTKGGCPVNRFAFVVPVTILVLSLTLWTAVPCGGEERRIHGIVIDAQATYCEPKKEDGCTGTLTLGTQQGRAAERLTVKVPLGAPISDGCEILSFGELEGRHVVITEMDEAAGPIALAVSVPPVREEDCG